MKTIFAVLVSLFASLSVYGAATVVTNISVRHNSFTTNAPGAGLNSQLTSLRVTSPYLQPQPGTSDKTIVKFSHTWAGGTAWVPSTTVSPGWFDVFVPFADNYYSQYRFRYYTNNWLLQDLIVAEPCTMIKYDNATYVTLAGTWTAGTDTNTYFGGWKWSATTNDTATLAASGRSFWIRTMRTVNGGYAMVSVDGDPTTKPNRAPKITQAMIDAGFFPSDSLGKAYIETYGPGTATHEGADSWLPIADGLADRDHVVVLTVMGSKRAASSGARLYLAGFGVGGLTVDGTSTLSFAPTWIMHQPSGAGISGANASVFSWNPGSGSTEFMTEIHGDSIPLTTTLTVNGTNLTPGVSVYGVGDAVRLIKRESLYHTSSGKTNVAVKTSTYDFRAGRVPQLDLLSVVQFNTNGTTGAAYSGMALAAKNVLNDTGSTWRTTNTINRVVIGTYDLNPPIYDNNYKGNVKAPALMWDSNEPWVFEISSNPTLISDYANSDGNNCMFWDVNNYAGKIYHVALSGTFATVPGTTYRWNAGYSMFYVPDKTPLIP